MSSRVALPGVTLAHLHHTMARFLQLHNINIILLFCGAGQLQRQLAAEQEAHRAVSRDLAGAQKDLEEVVQHNCELQRANASMGEEAHQVQMEQEEMRARFEAQAAELTSVKVSLCFSELAEKLSSFFPMSCPLSTLVFHLICPR